MIFNKYVLSLALIIAASHGLANGAQNRAQSDITRQAYEDLIAGLVGGGSGYIVARAFNEMELLPKFKERPLTMTVIGASIIAIAGSYRENIARNLGGARALGVSAGTAFISFGWNLRFDSKEGASADINTPVGSKHYRYQ